MLGKTKEELEGYIHTLDICFKELPTDAHIAHRERLAEIRDHFRFLLRFEEVQSRDN